MAIALHYLDGQNRQEKKGFKFPELTFLPFVESTKINPFVRYKIISFQL